MEREFTHCQRCKRKLTSLNYDWKYRHLHKKCYKELEANVRICDHVLRTPENKDIDRGITIGHRHDCLQQLDYRNYI